MCGDRIGYIRRCGTVGYTQADRRYLNVTNRCNLACVFCPKAEGCWSVAGHDLQLQHEPTVDEILRAAGNPADYREVVFSGLGEPTLRLYPVLDTAARLRDRGACVRLQTDGLANLIYRRDITPDLEGIVDALSVSLNACHPAVYAGVCRPRFPVDPQAVLDFAARAAEFVPEVTLTAVAGVPGVDYGACERAALELGLGFRRRVPGSFAESDLAAETRV